MFVALIRISIPFFCLAVINYICNRCLFRAPLLVFSVLWFIPIVSLLFKWNRETSNSPELELFKNMKHMIAEECVKPPWKLYSYIIIFKWALSNLKKKVFKQLFFTLRRLDGSALVISTPFLSSWELNRPLLRWPVVLPHFTSVVLLTDPDLEYTSSEQQTWKEGLEELR